jgi:uncharacterized protein YoaH (UPF0181 family)
VGVLALPALQAIQQIQGLVVEGVVVRETIITVAPQLHFRHNKDLALVVVVAVAEILEMLEILGTLGQQERQQHSIRFLYRQVRLIQFQ